MAIGDWLTIGILLGAIAIECVGIVILTRTRNGHGQQPPDWWGMDWDAEEQPWPSTPVTTGSLSRVRRSHPRLRL